MGWVKMQEMDNAKENAKERKIQGMQNARNRWIEYNSLWMETTHGCADELIK